jgi:riboflavin-specific deaminase-like protein
MPTSAKDRVLDPVTDADAPDVWPLLKALTEAREFGLLGETPAGWRLDADGKLEQTSDPASAWVTWTAAQGFRAGMSLPPVASALLDLYLPVCVPPAVRTFVIGHLALSLDGCIATLWGDAVCVTGRGNIRNLHRLRALCDAFVVGAGTVAADDPRLTTRLVPGTSPVRIVLDPQRRLDPQLGVFTDGAAPTIVVCAPGATRMAQVGAAEVLELEHNAGGFDLTHLIAALRERGCRRLMVEGGGITVSRFLAAGLLDRLHVAISPVIIGGGRRGLQLPAAQSMQDARRPAVRLYRMGEDVLFDCVPAEWHPPHGRDSIAADETPIRL